MLDYLHDEPDPRRRRLIVLGLLTRQLAPHGIEPILVGGGALELYTAGGYATKDMDLALHAGAGRSTPSMASSSTIFPAAWLSPVTIRRPKSAQSTSRRALKAPRRARRAPRPTRPPMPARPRP